MLRRAPTSITLTPEDVAAYEDRRLAAERQRQRELQENANPNTSLNAATSTPMSKNISTPKKDQDGKIDPNDELKPLPGDRARVRSGAGMGVGMGREERIIGTGVGR